MTRNLANDDVRAALRKIADGYSDSLKAPTRQRILKEAASGRRADRLASRPLTYLPQLSAAAAVLVVLALPALNLVADRGGQEPSPIRDLEVTQQDGRTILTWSDGEKPRRVIRATDRAELARLDTIPGEVVSGERYVDMSADSAKLVYYVVE